MKVMMIIKEKGNISITSKTVVGGTERFAQLMMLNNPSIILTEIPTIISKSKKYFVSVKMEGPIQLASGQGQSTAELFEAASDNLSGKDSIVLKSIIKSLRTISLPKFFAAAFIRSEIFVLPSITKICSNKTASS